MNDTICIGDLVFLALEDGKSFLLRMEPGKRHSTHRGAIDHDRVIGRDFGSTLTLSTSKTVHLLRPRWIDKMMKVHRQTNIMYPKDVAQVIASLGLGSGSRVVEIGCGSGAMSQSLAHAVAPAGTVYSYDRREDFLALAERNCKTAGVTTAMEFRLRQAGDALEPGVDAVFCDVPEPWTELPVIWDALRGSGRFAAGVPTFNQAERLAAALIGQGFAMVYTMEILLREILARPGRTRPAHRMVGHTQLLITAVKVTPAETAVDDEVETAPGTEGTPVEAAQPD